MPRTVPAETHHSNRPSGCIEQQQQPANQPTTQKKYLLSPARWSQSQLSSGGRSKNTNAYVPAVMGITLQSQEDYSQEDHEYEKVYNYYIVQSPQGSPAGAKRAKATTPSPAPALSSRPSPGKGKQTEEQVAPLRSPFRQHNSPLLKAFPHAVAVRSPLTSPADHEAQTNKATDACPKAPSPREEVSRTVARPPPPAAPPTVPDSAPAPQRRHAPSSLSGTAPIPGQRRPAPSPKRVPPQQADVSHQPRPTSVQMQLHHHLGQLVPPPTQVPNFPVYYGPPVRFMARPVPNSNNQLFQLVPSASPHRSGPGPGVPPQLSIGYSYINQPYVNQPIPMMNHPFGFPVPGYEHLPREVVERMFPYGFAPENLQPPYPHLHPRPPPPPPPLLHQPQPQPQRLRKAAPKSSSRSSVGVGPIRVRTKQVDRTPFYDAETNRKKSTAQLQPDPNKPMICELEHPNDPTERCNASFATGVELMEHVGKNGAHRILNEKQGKNYYPCSWKECSAEVRGSGGLLRHIREVHAGFARQKRVRVKTEVAERM